MTDVIFKAENVVKKYKKKRFPALRGFQMEIRRGDIYGFIGQNGAGKTTLMRILAGFARQTSGCITLFGESSRKGLCQKRRYINGIIETPAFYPGLTAWDNLEVCCLRFIHRGKMVEQISARELTEKCRRYLSLTVDDAARTVEILRKTFGKVRAEIDSENTVHVYGGSDLGGEMMKALLASGITVGEMTVRGEDLEQYYLSLIKDDHG